MSAATARPAQHGRRVDIANSGPHAAKSYRVDTLSIVGLALALGAIIGGQWIEGGAFGSLLQAAAFTIVVGGTLGAVLLQTPMGTFVDGLKLTRWVVTPPAIDNAGAITRIADWARAVRKEGMLSLENHFASCPDTYTRNGLQMLVDGFESEKIKDAMDNEITAFENRYRSAARIWEAAGGYAPTVGILGAVLGLIHVMENLSDPSKLGAASPSRSLPRSMAWVRPTWSSCPSPASSRRSSMRT